jgi:hypothetical protein
MHDDLHRRVVEMRVAGCSMGSPCVLPDGRVKIDSTTYSPDNKDQFIADMQLLAKVPERLSRREYEQWARKVRVEALPDEDLGSYADKYGDYNWQTYFAVTRNRGNGWKMTLRQRRWWALQKEQGRTASQMRTAGEVRFIKDRGDDKSGWAWGAPGPEERGIKGTDFEFQPGNLKPIAGALRSTLMALGHAISAHNTFSRIKSGKVSPDGALGGKGYIMKIADIRRQYMNCVEALSSLSDTLYDETTASHWTLEDEIGVTDNRERQEVKQIVDDAEAIKKDPEEWAQEEDLEMDDEHGKTAASKTASKTASKVADRYLNRSES